MTPPSGHWMNEPDIGSGTKSQAQRDIEREQQMIDGDASGAQEAAGDETQMLRRGDHLARIATRKMDDGLFEAQVYVRLTREPELAETYIPVGSYPTEEEARSAAEERARRALDEQEF